MHTALYIRKKKKMLHKNTLNYFWLRNILHVATPWPKYNIVILDYDLQNNTTQHWPERSFTRENWTITAFLMIIRFRILRRIFHGPLRTSRPSQLCLDPRFCRRRSFWWSSAGPCRFPPICASIPFGPRDGRRCIA